ncbi:MAG: ATP-binding protein [bacterium]
MIITSVRAENVLKYRELTLENLPASGVIAISGPNESGKSSIGETICFALFGRTFSLGPDQLDKIVHWGDNHCSVILRFEVEGAEYELSRFLDKDGNHSAKLCLASDLANPIARGVGAVADAMFEFLGYEFEEFIESFYLAQREITTPHPHSLAVKIMAGVAPLEYVSQTFEEEIDHQNEMLEELNTEIQTLEAENGGLEIESGRLEKMESIAEELRTELSANQASARDLESASLGYINNVEEVRREKGRLGRTRFFRFVFFLFTLVLGGVWGLLKQWPHGEESQLVLKEALKHYPQLQASDLVTLGMVAAGVTAVWLLLWIKVSSIRGSLKRLKQEAATLADVMREVRNIGEAVPDSDPEADDEAALPVRPDERRYQFLLNEIPDTLASPLEVREYVEAESEWLRAVLERKEVLLQSLGRDIEDERDAINQSERLHEVTSKLNERVNEIQVGIDAHQLSIELLEGASEHMSNHFNRDVRELVAKTLPIFTQNRYEHLRLDEDLNVKVFSSDKREFMDLEEVSSGTQRQIMLALRLALSQKLLNRAVPGSQFAFLDEPFAFFDEDRTRNALQALNDLGEDFSQIWIVSQTFPKDSGQSFSVKLECARERDRLQHGA